MSVKNKIDCFDNIKVGNLKDEFEKLIKDGMSLQEQRDIGTKLALDYHQKLFNDLEGFKKLLNIKSKDKYVSPDKSAIVKKIQDEYQSKINEANIKEHEPKQAEEKPQPQKPITEDKPATKKETQTKAKELADKDIGKYEKKAREIADKIKKSELPDWLKADLPDNTKTSGGSYDQIKKALADAVIEMGRLLDKGVEYAEAVKQAIKGLVDLQGEENRDSIEKGFGEYYSQQANVPPTPPKQKEEGGEKGEKKKGILNRLYEATSVPKEAKAGFEAEGLKYQTKSQKEAEGVAKGVVEEFGIGEAILMAKAGTFDGDVNSLIYAVSLNNLAEQEAKETDPAKKYKLAKKFAEVAIDYDVAARTQGRFNAAINYFYKNSPLGVQLKEEADRKDAFDDFAKGKEKSWKEWFEEFKDEPDFKEFFKQQVAEAMKAERAKSRKARVKKVREVFAKAKAQFKQKGATYSTIIPPQIITGALDIMEKAYLAGEAIVKVVQDGIDYINKEFGTSWDSDKFRQEWEEKLAEKGGLTEEEIKLKTLERFRNKLKGLSDKQRDEVVRKMFDKVVQAGALEYDDLRNIISETLGYGKLTPQEAERLQELVNKRNAVTDAATNVLEQKTEQSLIDYKKAQLEAAKAGRELQEMLWNKPDILKRITSVMQLNTLGIPALINNPIYNLFNQLGVRFPVFLVNDVIDRVAGGVAKKLGKTYDREYNIWASQEEFFKKLGLGSKEAFEQIRTGLNRADYTQKELYGQQIRPKRAIKDLFAYYSGKKKLTNAQKWDKIIQATVGVPAEAVARLLNVGDKPQRFAAEGAAAATFAKSLGLKDIDYKIFIEFPKEMAYEAYKQQGLSDTEAAAKADYVAQAIIKEGQRSTFQQDNLLNDMITGAFGMIGGKDSGKAALAKTLLISPYIKIPTNAFWSMYNLLNPEVAIVQAGYHATRASILAKKDDYVASKMQKREARYWMAHAIVGMATRAVIIALVQAGVFVPGNSGDESKKERQSESFFDQPGSLNITKLWAIMQGKDPSKINGGVVVSNRWFGQFGALGNSISRKWEDATPEQRANQQMFWNTVLGKMELEGLKELQNGVFANTSSLLEIINQNGSIALDRYLMGTINLFSNILQPAAIAQIKRASIDEVPSATGDTFLQKLNQNFAQRSDWYRKAFDVQIKRKRSIWGEPIPKGGNTLSRMFGITNIDTKKEGRALYDDYLRTMDIGFLPPSVPSILNGKKLTSEQLDRLEQYIGQSRKALVLPYANDDAVIPIIGKKYSQLKTDDQKKAVLSYLFELGRNNGLELFYKDYKDFVKPEKTIQDQVEDSLLEEALKLIKMQSEFKKQ